MTDEKRSRRPSSARSPRAAAGRTDSGPTGSVQLAGEPEPSLGDVRFDEWFETPMFESDADERLEELATVRRGPMRLAASTFLRLNARASQVRRKSAGVADTDWLVQADPAEAAPPPAPAPEAAAPDAPRARATNGRAPAAAPAPTPVHQPSVATAGGPGVPAPLRQRISQVLDRWAEREAATQVRLERLILPKRWQA